MKKVVVQKDFDLSTTKGKVQALAYLYPVLDAIEDDERRQKFVIAIDEALGITSHDDELFAPLVNMLGELTIKEVGSADKVSVQRDGLTYAYVEVTAHEDSNP